MTHRAPAPTTAKLGHQLLGLRSQHLPLRVGDVRRVARGAASTPASQHRTTGRLGRDKVHRTPQGLLDSGVGSTTPPLPEAPAHTSPRHADVIKPLLAHPTAPDESPVVCQQALTGTVLRTGLAGRPPAGRFAERHRYRKRFGFWDVRSCRDQHNWLTRARGTAKEGRLIGRPLALLRLGGRALVGVVVQRGAMSSRAESHLEVFLASGGRSI
jgi:hypothetical protein